MPQPTPDFFEFQGLRFDPAQASILRMVDGAKSYIRPKQRDLLVVLLSHPGETVSYKELWQTIWREIEDFAAVRRTMTETKSNLDKLLRSILKSETSIIQTISGQGYSIRTVVIEHWKERPPVEATAILADAELAPTTLPVQPATLSSPLNNVLTSPSLFEAHPWHAIGSCTIYSAGYVLVLLLEIAYSSDQLWRPALQLSPLVFSWVFITSITALAVDWKLTLKGKMNGLLLLILSFISSALALYGMLSFFLPQHPVTEARFQSQTAQGAYLKNIAFYFLPLVIVFLLIPFHLVASLTNQLANNEYLKVRDLLLNKPLARARGAIYIRPRTLGMLLFVSGIASLPLTFWLLDHLKPGPYMNRFTLLVMFRLILYVGLGAECLLWYSRTLDEIKEGLD